MREKLTRKVSFSLGLPTGGDWQVLDQWRALPEWPASESAVKNTIAPFSKEAVIIAKDRLAKPIGLAHLSATGLPDGVAQYGVAIPLESQRSYGRGRDLLLLTIGAAFFVFRYYEIFSIISSDKLWLLKMCLSGGFSEERNFRFIGVEATPDNGVQVVRTTPSRWMAIWGDEFWSKAEQDQWLMRSIISREVTPDRQTPKASSNSELCQTGSQPFSQQHIPPRKVLL
jgi:hypothetical protein